MVTYTHFGKQPDVLKHLVLCEVLQIEKPQIYVETNSACAIYTMTLPLHYQILITKSPSLIHLKNEIVLPLLYKGSQPPHRAIHRFDQASSLRCVVGFVGL